MKIFQGNGAPQGQGPAPQKSKFPAAVVTVIVCVVLAVSAVVISVLNPSNDFEFIPSGARPGTTHYSDMKYERPDGEKLTKSLAELTQMIKDSKSFTDQSRLFVKINEMLVNYRTMSSLAKIKYYSDTTDEFYKSEHELLSVGYVDVYDKICELLDTIASSTFKSNYERSFFGIGYFSDWKPMDRSDKATELMQKEKELIAEYQDSVANAFVVYNGEEIHVPSEELYTLSPDDYAAVIALYTEKYSREMSEIYIELVKVRLAIAKECNTDYITLAYNDLGREYTPEEATAYMNSIVKDLLPALDGYTADPSILKKPVDTVTSFYHLSLAASKMGSSVEDAFDYMMKYGLYDLSASSKKQALSFEIFLEKYNSPFIYSAATGTADDFSTFAHEFGHFVDDYVNLGANKTIDSAEIASQAMAYIMPFYSNGMGDISANDFLKLNVYSTFDLYRYSAFINGLETAVYSLSLEEAEELTVEGLIEIAENVALEAGFNEVITKKIVVSWFEIQHVYIAPMYYVSYAISNDIALQVLEAELLDPGKGGVKAFVNVLERSDSRNFAENITKAGFESPFAEGRTAKIAKLIDGIFNPPAEETPSENDSTPSAGAEELRAA